ncbi:MAG TPA: DNA helicase RecQ [Clostridiales bacterium]|jgi:ATP-dependent DNA helicase RecQ|nr:DNA helicase RecQ [Clostridiales bacterium]HBL82426.1 DNA helicase RecQ [Clostridiales bacterium]
MQKEEILKQYFGYKNFRNGQGEIIDNILEGRDIVGIMPTGAGKSLCYQIPAIMFDGITLVISPLISLMKDQVEALKENGVPAAYINSSLSFEEIKNVIKSAHRGNCKLLYVAPERLDTEWFCDFAGKVDISMVTIDEAHCISQWGQDFRPSYLKICSFIENLPKKPVIAAFTATATEQVREDIIKILNLDNPFVITTGFNRENLYFEVQKPKNKYDVLVDYLKSHTGKSGIVYCSTRKNVDEVWERLNKDRFSAARYHAGLEEEERTENQEDFLYDRKTVMVATNAFGMGIDKSNVAFVIHYNMPKDLESYYQEAGRAGRDGSPADCILLYGGQDVRTNQFLIEKSSEESELRPDEIAEVKRRDRERLKQMTFYCHTQSCLREYILRYFGERSENFCGNCGNCNTNFEELDITEHAQKIISCVVRMHQRYGVKMIADVLRGSRNERLLRFRLDKLTTYGIMKDVSENQIRDIVNHLILGGYLTQSDGDYPVLQLTGKSRDILSGNAQISMKLVREKPAADVGREQFVVQPALLEKLKSLRLELARKQRVPSYVIFTDAALTDMCAKMPVTSEEFLEVSGVGKAKLERFGEQFLKVIKEFRKCESVTEICAEVKRNYEIRDVSLDVFLRQVNALLKAYGKHITLESVWGFFGRNGMLQDVNGNTLVSDYGESCGLMILPGIHQDEVFLNAEMIHFLLAHLEEFID